MRKNAEEERVHESAPRRAALVLDIAPRGLQQRAERHSGRTRGLARAATEAEVEMPNVGVGNVEPPFGDGAHEVDTAARRVHFLAENAVGGTGGQTDTAVHARSNRIDCSGCRESGLTREWPVQDGHRLRTYRRRGLFKTVTGCVIPVLPPAAMPHVS